VQKTQSQVHEIFEIFSSARHTKTDFIQKKLKQETAVRHNLQECAKSKRAVVQLDLQRRYLRPTIRISEQVITEACSEPWVSCWADNIRSKVYSAAVVSIIIRNTEQMVKRLVRAQKWRLSDNLITQMCFYYSCWANNFLIALIARLITLIVR